MLKNTVLLITLITCWSISNAQSIFDLSFKNIDNEEVQLKSMAGKKILFIVLPVSEVDSFSSQIISFSKMHMDSIQVIGALSIELGYKEEMNQIQRSKYSGSNIILTAMHVTKGSGAEQSPVFSWLTNKSKNHYFDRDADKPGAKYFISFSGRLYAVLSHLTALNSPMVNSVISSGTK